LATYAFGLLSNPCYHLRGMPIIPEYHPGVGLVEGRRAGDSDLVLDWGVAHSFWWKVDNHPDGFP
jgi:hypothetical protein